MPTLLSSPTVSFPRPGFPQVIFFFVTYFFHTTCNYIYLNFYQQRILDESSTPGVSSVTTSLPNTTTASSFNYLYEYSETRKVLEEFFKPDEAQEKTQQQFRVSIGKFLFFQKYTSRTGIERGAKVASCLELELFEGQMIKT